MLDYLTMAHWKPFKLLNCSSQSITHDNIKQCIFPNMKMFYDKVYGKTIDGIKDLLRFLLSEPSTGRALKRQVAFLFFFYLFYFFSFYILFFRQVAFFFFYVIFLLLFSIFFRQVAFLFDFEEIEHTTVLGLTLQVIHNRLEYLS